MSARHTAGPWVMNPLCAQVDSCEVSRLGGLLPIAQLLWPTDERSEAETEANARLIAAAPELYDALSTVMVALEAYRTGSDYFPEFPEWEAAATAALAKARGESPPQSMKGKDHG